MTAKPDSLSPHPPPFFFLLHHFPRFPFCRFPLELSQDFFSFETLYRPREASAAFFPLFPSWNRRLKDKRPSALPSSPSQFPLPVTAPALPFLRRVPFVADYQLAICPFLGTFPLQDGDVFLLLQLMRCFTKFSPDDLG